MILEEIIIPTEWLAHVTEASRRTVERVRKGTQGKKGINKTARVTYADRRMKAEIGIVLARVKSELEPES